MHDTGTRVRTTDRGAPPSGSFGLVAATFVAVWAGCGTVTIDEYETCALELAAFDDDPGDEVAPELTGAAGDVIVLVGTPLTEVRDTHVELGGLPAEVTEVTRSGCETCDGCRDDAGCAPCGLCAGLPLEPAYRASCFGDPLADPPVVGACASCVETMSFVVPDGAPPGWAPLWVVNRNGQSEAIPFLVLGAPDSGDTGTGTGDTGPGDTGTAPGETGDTGTAPGETGDTGTGETGDTGTSTDTGDTGSADTGAGDTGSADTGSTI